MHKIGFTNWKCCVLGLRNRIFKWDNMTLFGDNANRSEGLSQHYHRMFDEKWRFGALMWNFELFILDFQSIWTQYVCNIFIIQRNLLIDCSKLFIWFIVFWFLVESCLRKKNCCLLDGQFQKHPDEAPHNFIIHIKFPTKKENPKQTNFQLSC